MRKVIILLLVGVAALGSLAGYSPNGIGTPSTLAQRSQDGIRPASGMGFQGDPPDNFWTFARRYCTDGFSIAATHTLLSNQNLSFSVQLGGATPDVRVALPAPVVQGDGSVLVNNSQSFLFQTPQAVGTPVTMMLERWDHGNQPIDLLTGDEPGPSTDASIGDDIASDPDAPVVEDCLTGARITTSTLTCSGFTASGTAVLPNGYAAVRVWNNTSGALLIDSYKDKGVPAAYAPIAADDSYSVSAGFTEQPPNSSLRGRVYWAPTATFGSWDGGHFDDVTAICPPTATATVTGTTTTTATATTTATTTSTTTATATGTTTATATGTTTATTVPVGGNLYLPIVQR